MHESYSYPQSLVAHVLIHVILLLLCSQSQPFEFHPLYHLQIVEEASSSWFFPSLCLLRYVDHQLYDHLLSLLHNQHLSREEKLQKHNLLISPVNF